MKTMNWIIFNDSFVHLTFLSVWSYSKIIYYKYFITNIFFPNIRQSVLIGWFYKQNLVTVAQPIFASITGNKTLNVTLWPEYLQHTSQNTYYCYRNILRNSLLSISYQFSRSPFRRSTNIQIQIIVTVGTDTHLHSIFSDLTWWCTICPNHTLCDRITNQDLLRR